MGSTRLLLPTLLLMLMAATATAAGSSSSLAAELQQVLFFQSGTAKSSDHYVDVGMSVSYNEPDNVTCSVCGWAVHAGWTYPWMETAPAPAGQSNTTTISADGHDLPGNDLTQQQLPAGSTAGDCAKACCALAGCKAFVFEAQSDVKIGGCVAGAPCCFLKSAASTPVPKTVKGGIVAGTAVTAEPSYAAPPLGIRSAPQLGGYVVCIYE